jgi:hypothetical protein
MKISISNPPIHGIKGTPTILQNANEMGVNTQVIRDWIIYGRKPRNVKLLE